MPVAKSSSQLEKQNAKLNRQRCINLLEKITKNLFRAFRNANTSQEQLVKRFAKLKKQLDRFHDVKLDSAYHLAMRDYIEQFGQKLAWDFDLEAQREKQMTQLNRIQKIKNTTAYKREKHRKDDREMF